MGNSWDHLGVIVLPPFEVTKNGLSVPVGLLVVIISGVGGGWCCLRQPGVCGVIGFPAGVPS